MVPVGISVALLLCSCWYTAELRCALPSHDLAVHTREDCRMETRTFWATGKPCRTPASMLEGCLTPGEPIASPCRGTNSVTPSFLHPSESVVSEYRLKMGTTHDTHKVSSTWYHQVPITKCQVSSFRQQHQHEHYANDSTKRATATQQQQPQQQAPTT